MSIQEGFEIDDSPVLVAVPVPVPPPQKEAETEPSLLDMICDKINDPDFDVAEISRWISAEIASVARRMQMQTYDPTEAWRLKAFSEQVKALRELGKQLTDTDMLNKRDSLNFDGPKFAFVLGVIVDLFGQSMKEAGVTEDMRVSVMKHLRDKMAENDVIIRRETAKIGAKTSK